jgi:hypothetical protein
MNLLPSAILRQALMIAILGLSINRLLAAQTKAYHPSDVSVGHRVSSGASASQPNSSTSAQDFVAIMRMVTNEGIARAQHEHFSYISEERSTRTDGHLWTEKAVETDDGVLRRLLAVDHLPLTLAAREAEERRIEDLVAHPQAFRRLNENHKEDETHAIQLLQMLPRAFRISSDGEQLGCIRFAFRPDPSFQPSTYEERIVHVLEGTVSVREPEHRLCDLEAAVSQPVEFGFGLLGKLNSGGHFSFQRMQVDATHWKTVHVSVHVDGRILLLKSLSRDQEVTRTDIISVPQHLNLEQAAKLTRPQGERR